MWFQISWMFVRSQILVQYFPSILTEFSSFSPEGHKFQTSPWNLDKSQVKPLASQESSFIKTIKMHAILFNLYLGRPRFRVLSKQSKKNHNFVKKFCQAEYIICIPDGSIFRGTPEHVWSIRSGSKSLYPANMTFISLWCLFCFYCVNLNFSISGSCRNNSVSRLWQKLEK